MMFPSGDAIGMLWYTMKISLLKHFWRWCHLPRFLHRGTAGNMKPLTGGDAGMIRGGSLAIDTHEKVFQKSFRQRFPKSSILDIKECCGGNHDDDPW